MIIKKYIGKTEEEAVEAAKKELGSGVVVMNVKAVKRKGVFASLRSRMTEVTVALEEEMEKKHSMDRGQSMEQTSETLWNASIPGNASAPGKDGTSGNESFPRKAFTALAASESSKNIEQKLDSLQSLLISQFQKSESEKLEEAGNFSESSKAERTEEKNPDNEKNSELVKFMKLLYNTMIDNEVDEKYANLIMEEIDKLNKPNMPFDYTLANTYQKMILKFGKAAGIVPAKSSPKIVMFIGPTGVGKTTTIAKIASSFVVDEKKKLALLTADTYRIAAADQLRTYANILEVPFRVVYTEEEVIAAVKDFREFDYIFVDTAGHSHQNEEQIEKMKSLINCVNGIVEKQVFLVLSATTKYRDLLRIADNYKEMTEFQLIFTKLDETDSVGNLLNLKLYADTSIAYVTCGQNVPDDIEVFNPQKTVKQLLGGKK